MDTKLYRISAFCAAALLAATCIYPYEVDIEKGGEYPMVVEGDINLGGTSRVKLSYVRPFHPEEETVANIFASGYIEGEDGTRVRGVPLLLSSSLSSVLDFDTSGLRTDQKYRLCFSTYEGNTVLNEYESDWLTPCPAPTIDALTYSKNEQFQELWIGLSMHCNGSHYFRWTFTETWEYHSDIQSYIEYVPRQWSEREMKYMGGYYQHLFPTMYYCWKSEASSKVNLFSTANQTEDRFEKLAFHTIPLDDKRLQVMYRIDVRLDALSEDAYNYWQNLQQSSHEQGSIFAPVPSEMASNVHCITDPSIQVMGYLNAAVQARAGMFYDNEKEGFFKPSHPMERLDTTIAASNLALADQLFREGFLPYHEIYTTSTTPSDYTWALSVCIDCRKQGGSKERPEDWPSGHI